MNHGQQTQETPSKRWRETRELRPVLDWAWRFMISKAQTQSPPMDQHLSILDIGCGEGRITIPATTLGYRVYGIDLSINGLKLAHEKLKIANVEDNAYFLVADAESLPFRKHSFSLVYCIGTFEYFKNLNPTFREVQRILIPEGKLLFNFRNETPVRTGDIFRRIVRTLFRRNQHMQLRSSEQLKKWSIHYHRLEQVKYFLKSAPFVINRIWGYFLLLPSDIEIVHRFFGMRFAE